MVCSNVVQFAGKHFSVRSNPPTPHWEKVSTVPTTAMKSFALCCGVCTQEMRREERILRKIGRRPFVILWKGTSLSILHIIAWWGGLDCVQQTDIWLLITTRRPDRRYSDRSTHVFLLLLLIATLMYLLSKCQTDDVLPLLWNSNRRLLTVPSLSYVQYIHTLVVY